MATLNAIHATEKRRNKFMAALQGIDLDENSQDDTSTTVSKKLPTVEEIQARAVARLTGDANLAGAVAEGITPDMGVEYMIMEGAEVG